jgi:hypothetical protein
MTRSEALAAVRRLASGLAADQAGILRLLERVSLDEDAEALRDALVELGAAVVLDAERG